ncbi:MAG: hypothetical protein H0U85_07510 [Gemmatimonadales bacterium]|nr:hypothetical protein [Gemmatimonadales bacterium]
MLWSRSQRIMIRPGIYRSTPEVLRGAIAGASLLILAIMFSIANSGAAGRLDGLLRLLWSGPVGRLLFRIASSGTRTASLAPRGSGSTTLAGGRSPLDVIAALPRSVRRQIMSVEPALRQLESEHAALGARESQLALALAEASAERSGSRAAQQQALVAELTEAKRVASDHRDAIAGVLDEMRLHLLRIKSGLGTPADVQRALDAARQSLPATRISPA